MQRLTFKNTLSCQKLDKKIAAVAETTDGRTDRCIKCQNRTAAFPTPNLSAIVARTVYELHSRCVSFYSPSIRRTTGLPTRQLIRLCVWQRHESPESFETSHQLYYAWSRHHRRRLRRTLKNHRLKRLKVVYSFSWEPTLQSYERHLPYRITQRDLSPDTGERAPP